VQLVDELGGTVVRLDDPVVREAVAADPTGYLLAGLPEPVLIDEYQHVPAVLDVIKGDLSRTGSTPPARWVLCGSVAIRAVEAAAESLGGRITDLTMSTLTIDERNRSPAPTLLSEILTDGVAALRGWRSSTPRDRTALLTEATRGGFPLLIGLDPDPRRRRLQNWVDAAVISDARALGTRKLDELARLLRYYAAATSGLIPKDTEAATDLGIERHTVANYRNMLAALHTIWELPAYSPGNARRQVTRASKLHITDSGLAAQQANRDTLAALHRDPAYAGAITETMVVNDLRVQAGDLDAPVRLSHYRDKKGVEVDLIFETSHGTVFGVEIKLGSAPQGDVWSGIRRLRDTAGERFAGGIVLCRVPAGRTVDGDLALVPLDAVWDYT
jgi:predicted AAA+ superfamily ATPase